MSILRHFYGCMLNVGGDGQPKKSAIAIDV